jgi:YidC/Oxa1 family membrane protein insertase
MQLRRLLALLLGLSLLLLLAGCFPGAGASRLKYPPLETKIETIDRLPDIEAVKLHKQDLETAAEKAGKDDPHKAENMFLAAYCAERLENYEEAIAKYEAVPRISGDYKAIANFRVGEIAANARPKVTDADKRALKGYTNASGYYPTGTMLVREPALASQPLGKWRTEPLRIAANSRADKFQRHFFSYRAIDTLVALLGRNPHYSYGLAVILIAVLVRVVTTPLTNRQFKSMREMQAVQPLLTELQKKYKDNKQKLMQEQMQIFKEHKINPMGGCLPMLVQMPFLIWVYRAVWAYNWQFENTSFLWIGNLANSDQVLLVLYAVSLYFSQKITTPPTADPQQQQMQKTMALLMPIMFLFMFKSMPAAFILYWFAQNVLMTTNQFFYLRKNPSPALQASGEGKQKKKSEKPNPKGE